MESSVGGSVETGLRIDVLGPVRVSRNAAAVVLPRSRKVRALLAYLSLAGPQSRSRLCDMFWDSPNDPRGELRWCVSKLRSVLDDPDRRRVVTTSDDQIALDLSDCRIDAVEVDQAVHAGLGGAARERLIELHDLFGGDLLDGLTIDGPEFAGWLSAQRHRYRAMHVAVLTELARSASGSDETFRCLDAWLRIAPFDQRAHEVMLDALVSCGRAGDAEDHLAATIRAFEHEGLDWLPLRDAWRALRVARPVTVTAVAPDVPPTLPRSHHRASVAIMPFADYPSGQPSGGVADGVTDDIITRLAKLRALFVIARGTVYALKERGIDPQEAGRILNVEFVVSGSVRRHGDRVTVAVELVETSRARIIWTDELGGIEETLSVLDAIVNRIVAAIADEIETAESNRALLKPPSSLDAWEAYHRGLWHMYKFNGPDNRAAEGFFRTALELDPTYSRAYAGLSFTHFQNAFLDLTPDRARQVELAFESASQSLGTDDRDPAAHWAIGRALWLRGAHGESLNELRRSIELSPNFALGHYTLGFVHCQTGDPRSAIDATNHSRQLSPFDPLQFGMLGTRAVAHVRLDELDEAAEWAVRAAARPNAHVHILAIAAECLALANRRGEASKFVTRIRERLPAYGVEDFLRAFQFSPDTAQRFRGAAAQIGFASR